jgi:hypothetical protein
MLQNFYGNTPIDTLEVMRSTLNMSYILSKGYEPGVPSGTKGCSITEKINRFDEIGFSLPVISDQIHYGRLYIQCCVGKVTETVVSD